MSKWSQKFHILKYVKVYSPQVMYPLLTDRPTKFLSFTCPLKVLIQQPVSTDHNFSSLSVELNREREKVN